MIVVVAVTCALIALVPFMLLYGQVIVWRRRQAELARLEAELTAELQAWYMRQW